MRAVVAAAILSACLIGPAVAQAIPVDEPGFTTYVAKRLQQALGNKPVQVKGPLTLAIGSMQANLDRIHAFCKTNAAGCPREVDTYVRAAAQVHAAQGLQATRTAVRAVVRSAQYLQKAQASAGPNASPLHTRQLVEGLLVVAVLDSPRAVRMLTHEDSTRLGVDAAKVHELALANLRKHLKPVMEVAKPAQSGKIGSLSGDYFHPSRLALVDSWAPLARAQGGTLIVVAPATDTVLYVGEDSPVAVDALRTLARNLMSRAPNPLSDVLLRWSPQGWKKVP